MDVVVYIIVANILLLPFARYAKQNQLYFLPAVMGALSLAGAAWKGIQAIQQNKLANGINPFDPTYEVSPYAKANLGLAQSLFNGRMAGATDLERNIQANQASTLGSIDRNATSSSQALALAAATQGQSNNALQQLQANEAQNKYNLAGQVTNANRDLTAEQGKVYQDQLRKYENDVQAKTALRQAAANNLSGLFTDLTSGAMMASSLGGFNRGGGLGTFNPTSVGNVSPLAGSLPINTSAALTGYSAPGIQLGQPALGMNTGLLFNPLFRR